MTYTNCDLILSVKDAEDHEKWLKTRDLGIGGSDAARHPLLKKKPTPVDKTEAGT